MNTRSKPRTLLSEGPHFGFFDGDEAGFLIIWLCRRRFVIGVRLDGSFELAEQVGKNIATQQAGLLCCNFSRTS